MKRVVALLLVVFFICVGVFLLLWDKPIHKEDITGTWIVESGEGFDLKLFTDDSFSLEGKGIKNILTTVVKTVTGKDQDLKGRYELSYDPFHRNRLILHFDTGEVQRHEIAFEGGYLILSGRKMVRAPR